MKRSLNTALVSALAALLLPAAVFAADKMIYGDDDRLEYFEAPSLRRAIANSVVSLWKAEDIESSGAGFRLKTSSFSAKIQEDAGVPLCAGEPYREQPVGPFCSGSLIGEDLVMTAGHCVPSENKCKSMKFVFGFNVRSPGGSAISELPAENVYSCSGIVVRKFESSTQGSLNPEIAALLGQVMELDYAVVRLDRKVGGRRPLPVSSSKGLKNGDPLFIIGHPMGLPLKVADGAAVRDIKGSEAFFTANLDSYGGNSGSPVFNARTSDIVGILVRGDRDFRAGADGACLESNRVPNGGGQGESVTKIPDDILNLLKPAGQAGTEKMAMDEPPDLDTGAQFDTDSIIERFNTNF